MEKKYIKDFENLNGVNENSQEDVLPNLSFDEIVDMFNVKSDYVYKEIKTSEYFYWTPRSRSYKLTSYPIEEDVALKIIEKFNLKEDLLDYYPFRNETIYYRTEDQNKSYADYYKKYIEPFKNNFTKEENEKK